MDFLSPEILIVLKLTGLFLLLFICSEILYRVLKIRVEITRKFSHVGSGLLTLLFPVLLSEVWQVAAICLSFLLFLLLSFRWKILPSINNVSRKTYGSVLFPLSVLLCFMFYKYMLTQADLEFQANFYFYLPIVVLAISDPLAALVGKHFNKEKIGKTLTGSWAFAISSFILSTVFMEYFSLNSFNTINILFYATAASIVSTIAERHSSKGWDNFTIPASLIVLLWIVEILAA